MINPKNVCTAAIAGFILSFLIGVFAGNHLLTVFIRALIFAAVFAVLSVGVSFLFYKFLFVPTASGEIDAPLAEAKAPSLSRGGSLVDITVDDEGLPDDAGSPRFSVSNNRPGLGAAELSSDSAKKEKAPAPKEPESSAEDTVAASVQASAPDAGPAFTAAPLTEVSAGQNHEKVPPKAEEAKNESAVHENKPSPEQGEFKPVDLAQAAKHSDAAEKHEAPPPQSNPEIDELPDIGALGDGVAASGEGSVISDSDFASQGSSSSSATFPDGKSAENKDAAVMAMAIQTILQHEKQ